MDNQSFEFLLNNFARLTNIVSEECPTFALFKSGFRSQLLFIAFKVQMNCFLLFPNLKEQQKSGRSPITVS